MHKSKLKLFSYETLDTCISALLFASCLYQELGLAFAAKYHALAAGGICSQQQNTKQRIWEALIQVANCDFQLGSFAGAIEFAFLAAHKSRAIAVGVLICAFAKLLILSVTMFSYSTGLEFHFNNLTVVAGQLRDIAFGEAILWRTIEIVVGAVLGAIWASIGFTLAGFVPIRAGVR